MKMSSEEDRISCEVTPSGQPGKAAPPYSSARRVGFLARLSSLERGCPTLFYWETPIRGNVGAPLLMLASDFR
jgi:hypothetical protein